MALSSFRSAGLAGTVTGVDSYWNVLTATATATTVDLSWPAAGGSPSSYQLFVNGVVENVGNVTSFSKTGLTAGTSYDFKVRPVFSSGLVGGFSFIRTSSPLGFNAATGGTTSDVSNYLSTGQTWRVHTFRANGTFTVTNATAPFSVLLVGNGGPGGGAPGGGGGGGGVYTNASMTLTAQAYAVTLANATFNGQTAFNGNGGQGSGNGNAGGSSGGPTSFGGGGGNGSAEGGGGGGAGGGGSNAVGNGGGFGGPGVSRNITGTAATYGAGGQGGNNTPGNAGRGFPGEQTGGVIIAYRIG